MDDKIKTYKNNSLYHCDRILSELAMNKDETDLFFGGEMRKAYIEATDKAISKTRKIRNKIRNIY